MTESVTNAATAIFSLAPHRCRSCVITHFERGHEMARHISTAGTLRLVA
jgi:hypothetical protein